MEKEINKPNTAMSIKLILKVLCTVALVWILFKKVGVNELKETLLLGDIRFVLLGFGFGIGFTLLKSYKWHYFVKRFTPGSGFKETFISYLVGLGIGIITPARAGELSRALYIKAPDKLSLVMLVLLDKFIDFCAVYLLASLGVFFFFGTYFFMIYLIVFIIIAYLFYKPIFFSKTLTRVFPRLSKKVSYFFDGLTHLDSKCLYINFFLSVGVYLIVICEIYYLILSFSSVSLKAAVIGYPLVMMVNLLPVTIGGIGVREGASAIVFSNLMVSARSAINASFLTFVFNTLIPALFGGLFLSKIKLNRER